MLGRMRSGVGVGSDAFDHVSPYLGQLASDEKLRRRVLAALVAGLAARQRAKKQFGLLGLATTLGTDPVLRAQVVEAVSQLQMARKRVQNKRRRRRSRGVLLLAAGVGVSVLALPRLRNGLVEKVRRAGNVDDWDSSFSENGLGRVESQVEGDTEVSTAH